MIDPLILVRFIHFAATLLAGGTVCFAGLVAGDTAFQRRCDLLIWIGLALALPTGAAWLVLLAVQILGAPFIDVCLHGGAWSVATGTRFGEVAMLRLCITLVLAALLFARATRRLQLAAVLVLVGPLAFIGHAGAKPDAAGDLYLATDVVHLLAATVWLGALPAFALFLITARKKADAVLRATRRFSMVGMISVGALLGTGLINSWNLVGSIAALMTTPYGRVLTSKIALFAAMVALAAVNRFVLAPRLPAPGALRALTRNSLAEAGLGLGVLLAVGALGILEPGGHATHESGTGIPPDAAFVHIHMPEVMADVTIEPGRVGSARATIRVTREDGSEFPTKEVKLGLDPPKAPPPAVLHDAERVDGATWQLRDIELLQPGVWTARVIILTEGGASVVLDAPIVIEPQQ